MAKFIQKRFRPIETLIVFCLIAILISAVYHRYQQLELRAKLQLVKMDLNHIQLSVRLFYIKKARYPKDLKELYEKGYVELQDGDAESFGSRFKGGYLYDPFGYVYGYDNRTGIVYLDDMTRTITLKNDGLNQ